MDTVDPALAILRVRIRIALRRGTGQMQDVDARLAEPLAAAAALAEWRRLGLPELDVLLDQYAQHPAGQPTLRAARKRRAGAAAALGGRGVAAATTAPGAQPPVPAPLAPAEPDLPVDREKPARR